MNANPKVSPTSHIRWPSIELLHNIVRWLQSKKEQEGDAYSFPKIRYRPKVKLDGTNAGVQILPSGEVLAQSRSQLLSETVDNAGFYRWVKDHQAFFTSLARPDRSQVIFGEWCGTGIRSGAAIGQIKHRVFAVFSIREVDLQQGSARLFVWPEEIRRRLPEHPELYILPWHGEELTLDFGDREDLNNKTELLNKYVAQVEACDPWVEAVFGVRGAGEGLVLYPLNDSDGADADSYMDWAFKAKGLKHAVVKQKRPVEIDPEIVRGMEGFAEHFVTPVRLEQGFQEVCSGMPDVKKTGLFLKWMREDVHKESVQELSQSGLEWRQVEKAVTEKARAWFIGKTRNP